MVARALLEATQLRATYGGRTVVDIERLTVGRGEVMAILGPNGSGKSTLFRLLLALQKPQSGTVSLDGEKLEAGSSARGRMAGVFQHPYLFAGTVRDNVRYGPRARRAEGARIDLLLGELGLLELAGRDVGQLSGGEMQRVALARALACEPEILLLDEPSASLDVMTQRRLRGDLARIVRARQLSLLLITHDPDDAFTLADRVAVMEGGRIVQTGTPLELMLDPLNAFVAAFTGAELLLNGVVESHDAGLVGVRIDPSILLWATHPVELALGTNVHVSYQPDDVALSHLNSGYESSARNNFELAVERVTFAGALARIALAGPPRLAAVITRRSAHDLEIQPGTRVTAHIKAAALRAFAASAP